MNDRPEDAQKAPRARRLWLIAAASVAGAAVGLAAVYGIGGYGRNANAQGTCRAAMDAAKRVAPLARGEVAAVTVASEPRQLPDLAFQDRAGQAKKLAEWRGRVVLLNLWATWCVPCRKEMPALDRLQARLGSPKFEVVAVNIDTRDPAKPKAWLDEMAITKLAYYADPTAKVFQDLKAFGRAFGMPTTIVVDPQGCEIAALAGPAEWASEDAVKLIEAAIGS